MGVGQRWHGSVGWRGRGGRRSGGRGRRGTERDGVAELLEARDVVTLALPGGALVEALEVGGAQVAVRFAVPEDVVGDDEDAVRHGDDGFWGATPAGQAMVLRGQVSAPFPTGTPGALAEHGPQPGVAFGEPPAQALAGA